LICGFSSFGKGAFEMLSPYPVRHARGSVPNFVTKTVRNARPIDAFFPVAGPDIAAAGVSFPSPRRRLFPGPHHEKKS